MVKYLKPALEHEREMCLAEIEKALAQLKGADGLYALGTINGLHIAKLAIQLMPEVV